MMNEFFGTGIPVSTGFDMGAGKPIDHRTVKSTHDDMIDIPDVQKYIGLSVYVIDEKKRYTWDGESWSLDTSTGSSGGDAYGPNVNVSYGSVYDDTKIISYEFFKIVEDVTGVDFDPDSSALTDEEIASGIGFSRIAYAGIS